MGATQNILSAAIMVIIFLVAGGIILNAQSKQAIERLQERQMFYFHDLYSNNLNTFLLITDENSSKQIGTLISYSMYQRKKVLNISGIMIDVEKTLKATLDEMFGEHNYYLEIRPKIDDISLNFVIDGSNSLSEERKELAEKLPIIINAAKARNRTVNVHIYINTLSPKCGVFQQKFAELGLTNATCEEIDGEHNLGELYLDPASSPDNYHKVFNVTPPYNFPGKPTTNRRELDYYEPDWAAGAAYASNRVGTQTISKLDIIFPMGDELSTSSFADKCFVTDFTLAGLDEGDKILCDLCERSCSDTETTATETRSLNIVRSAVKIAQHYKQIINPIFAYTCEFYSPAVNSSYKTNWLYWNLLYKAKRGKTYDTNTQQTLCSDTACEGCSTLDGTYNKVCLQPDCRKEIYAQMEFMANSTNGKVINLENVSQLSEILAEVIKDNIEQFTIKIGEKMVEEERFVYTKKLLLPVGNEFVDLKLWVYREPWQKEPKP